MYVVAYIFGYGSMIILCSVEHMANNYLSKLYKILQISRLFMNILQKKKIVTCNFFVKFTSNFWEKIVSIPFFKKKNI